MEPLLLKGEQEAGLNAGGTAEHNKYIVSRPGICNRIPWRDFLCLKILPEYETIVTVHALRKQQREITFTGKERAAWNF